MTGGLVLLCGRSFSGESTVAASLADSLPGRVVSRNEINEERGGRAFHSQNGLEPTSSPGNESAHGYATITGHRGDVTGEVMAAHQERLAS